MSSVLAPTPPAVPRPLRWTVDRFHNANAVGAFAGLRPVLIHGVIYEQGEMKPPHARAVELTDIAIRPAFGPGWRFRSQLPLVLGQDSDPFPDLAVIAGSPRDHTRHPTSAALVIEVSDTTLAIDLTEKAELYATADILDYWVLDLTDRRLLVFRDPEPLPKGLGATAYRTRLSFGPEESVAPLAAPNASVRVADLLP